MSAHDPDQNGETAKSASRDRAFSSTATSSSTSTQPLDMESPGTEDRQQRDRFSLVREAAAYFARLLSSFKGVSPVLFGGLAAVALSGLVAVWTSHWFDDIQIEVPDSLTILDGGSGYVTTMAWTSTDDGPLVVGTSEGFLVNVRRDGTLVLSSDTIPERYAPGRIVEIFPSDTNLSSEAVWASMTRGYAGYRLQTGAAYRGLAFRVADVLHPVRPGSDSLGGSVSFVPLFRAGVGLQSARQVAGALSRLTAIRSFMISGQPYVVTGYDSGAVLAFRFASEVGSLQPQSKEPAITLHSGPILAIASQAYRANTSVTFATAAADGTVVVHRLRADPPSSTARSVLFMAGGTSAQSVLYGPIARREGLMMDRAGRVLLLWDQGGGISVSRLDANDQPYFRTYNLAGIPRSAQRHSMLAAQTRLQALGLYNGNLDGVMGARTSAAFAAYRMRAGLTWIAPNDTDRLLSYLLPSHWATSAVALSPRGDLFAYSGIDGVVRIVRLTSGSAATSSTSPIALLGHRALVTRLSISPDGRMLASLDTSGRLLMTDLDRLLGISPFPLAMFSTAPLPEPLNPMLVDVTGFTAQ